MAKIYLIRHANTYDNLQKKFSGHIDSELSNLGLKQNFMLNKRLKNYCFDKIYTSPLKRAYITANNLNGKLICLDDLKEINFGDFEGLSLKEIKEGNFFEYNKFINQDEHYRFPSGESLMSFYERVKGALHHILYESKNEEKIAIVTHAGVIRCIVSELLCGNNSLHWNFQIDNCGITKITYKDNFPIINYINITDHLR